VPITNPGDVADRLWVQYLPQLIWKLFRDTLQQTALLPFHPLNVREEYIFQWPGHHNTFLDLRPSIHTKIHRRGSFCRGFADLQDELDNRRLPIGCPVISSYRPCPENRAK